jgi:hypothetical protein
VKGQENGGKERGKFEQFRKNLHALLAPDGIAIIRVGRDESIVYAGYPSRQEWTAGSLFDILEEEPLKSRKLSYVKLKKRERSCVLM